MKQSVNEAKLTGSEQETLLLFRRVLNLKFADGPKKLPGILRNLPLGPFFESFGNLPRTLRKELTSRKVTRKPETNKIAAEGSKILSAGS